MEVVVEDSQIFIMIHVENDKCLPVKSTSGSAAFDLSAYIQDIIVIHPGETKLIPTGLKMILPEDYCAKILSRSGLALKKKVFALNAPGLIDSDYRDMVGVIIHNTGKEDFSINPFDRIAQMTIEKVEPVKFQLLSDNQWNDHLLSERDNNRVGGFGSTGVQNKKARTD